MKSFDKCKAIRLPIFFGVSALILSACSFGQTGSRYVGEYGYHSASQYQVNASRYGSYDLRQSCLTVMEGCPGFMTYTAPMTYVQTVETQVSNPPAVSIPPVIPASPTISTPPTQAVSTPINCPFGTTPQADGSCLTTDFPTEPPVIMPAPPASPSTYTPPDYVFSDYNPVRK